jgi:ATP adenylyltransferase
VKQLWAPWRLEYIQGADEQHAFVLLNKFPYASGHLMVAPNRHEGEFGGLDWDEAAEIHLLASSALGALAETMSPQGFNLGWNLGRIAGAGVVDHVHMHVVPRWAGDTNFMPVLADVKVLPEALEESRRKIAAAWP